MPPLGRSQHTQQQSMFGQSVSLKTLNTFSTERSRIDTNTDGYCVHEYLKHTMTTHTHTHTHVSSITIHTWLSSVLPASVCGPHGTNTIFWRLIWNRFTKIYLFLRLIGGQVVKHSFSHRVCKLVQILLMLVSTRGLHQHGWNLWKCKVK